MSKSPRPPERHPGFRNWVAKHAGRFNTAKAFADRTAYKRHPKHKRKGDE